jgi:hypothetical protein
MIEILNLTDWKKMSYIKEKYREYGKQISQDGREFRRLVEEYNKGYFNHEHEDFIAHDNVKGYKLTADSKEIDKALLDYKKRGINQLIKYCRGMKARGENINVSLLIEEAEHGL